MGFNSRNQKAIAGNKLVLVRDLYVSDLDCDHSDSYRTRGNVLVKAGTEATYLEPGFSQGTFRVQFPDMGRAYWASKMEGYPNSFAKEGMWAINADLLRPASQDGFEVGKKFISPFEQTFFGSTLPAGTIVTVATGYIDSDGDVRATYMQDGEEKRRFIRWYTLVPVAEPAQDLLWGKYAYGQAHRFSEGQEPLVVFIRDITRSDLGSYGRPAPVSEVNRLMAPAGQIGKLDSLNLMNRNGKNQARITFLDRSHAEPQTDFWQLPLDCFVPLLTLDDGAMQVVSDLVSEDCDDNRLYSVGDTALVFLSTHDTKWDDDADKLVADTDTINHTFRDDDEVYILEVDRNELENEGLVYRIGFNEDGTGPTLWVRTVDLSDPE